MVMQSAQTIELQRKIRRPPGRSSRAASGIQRYGSAQSEAPYSEWTTSNDESGSGTSSGRSDELIVREPERDLALGGFRRVGTVDEVVRHGAREVTPDRSRFGIGWVRCADRLAQRRDSALPLDDEREGRPGGDELDE